MNILLLENSQHLREEFKQKFVMTWDEFQVVLKDFIDNMKRNNGIVFDFKMYEESLMWDRMHPHYPKVSFVEALALLREKKGKVLFMSEDEKYPWPSCELLYNNKNIRNFIAEADSNELADLIEDEWFGFYRLAAQGRYNPNEILPADLYVFDPSMEWFIVFTHETTDVETDDPVKESESRYCIVHI